MSLCVSVCNNCHLTYLFVIMLMKYSVCFLLSDVLKVLSLTLCPFPATWMLSGSIFGCDTMGPLCIKDFRWGLILWLFTYKSLCHGHIRKDIERCVSLSWSPRLETSYFLHADLRSSTRQHIHKNKRVINSWVQQVDTSDCVNEFVSRTADRAMHCCCRVCEWMLVSTLVRCALLTSAGPNEAC